MNTAVKQLANFLSYLGKLCRLLYTGTFLDQAASFSTASFNF